jgi:hypothetical protein
MLNEIIVISFGYSVVPFSFSFMIALHIDNSKMIMFRIYTQSIVTPDDFPDNRGKLKN